MIWEYFECVCAEDVFFVYSVSLSVISLYHREVSVCSLLRVSYRWAGYCTVSPQRFDGQRRRLSCHRSRRLRSRLTATCLPSVSAWKSRRMTAKGHSGETYTKWKFIPLKAIKNKRLILLGCLEVYILTITEQWASCVTVVSLRCVTHFFKEDNGISLGSPPFIVW